MKTIIFTVCVLLSGYYLASQTEAGNDLLSRYLPQQEIEQTAEQVKDKVDQGIEHITKKYIQSQDDKIAKLENRIIELEQMLQASKKRESGTLSETIELKYDTTTPNDEVVQTSPLVDEQKHTAKVQIPKMQTYDEFVKQRNTTNAPQDKIRKQKATLDDIASRMEVVSLQASRGAN